MSAGERGPRSGALLSGDERELWYAWKRAHELVRARITEDITTATGLSDPDVAILVRLDDADGTLRQNRLAALLGWDRSRLSHQLTRMESRGLLTRQRLANGADIVIADRGRELLAVVRPVHAAAVRRHFIDPLTSASLQDFHAALNRLAGRPDTSPHHR